MEDEFNNNNNNNNNNHGINFLDYARNYTFATISLFGTISCLAYGIAKDKPSAILAGGGILFFASARGICGYFNLRKIERGSDRILELESENEALCTENEVLKKRLELKLE